MTQVMTEQKIIQLNLTPEQIKKALPHELKGIENGFSDKTFTASGVDFEFSYDGESELLAKIVRKPFGISEQYCEQAVRDFFEI